MRKDNGPGEQEFGWTRDAPTINGRALDRILNIARTIANMDAEPQPNKRFLLDFRPA
jgi:hypothetical protein